VAAKLRSRFGAMTVSGFVLGTPLRNLATELAGIYRRGELVIVAGAGVSRASHLPGWLEMVGSIQREAASILGGASKEIELERVLSSLHGDDPIGRADSLRRLLKAPAFSKALHAALFGGAPAGTSYQPSAAHWHIASLVDAALMPNVFTSNYDELLEVAKRGLKRSGRVRHFHGRLPQDWTDTRLADPPVVTARDYAQAEGRGRYERVAGELADKTALLVGFSLADPNLTRLIRENARDCRALVIASPGDLTTSEQRLRLDLLGRFWLGLGIRVTAIEAHEELPAFLLALRREILHLEGRSLATIGEDALRTGTTASLSTWAGIRDWRDKLEAAVVAAKDVAPELRRDRTLRAGFYSVGRDGYLAHAVHSATTRRSIERPVRRLLAEDVRPWGPQVTHMRRVFRSSRPQAGLHSTEMFPTSLCLNGKGSDLLTIDSLLRPSSVFRGGSDIEGCSSQLARSTSQAGERRSSRRLRMRTN
jgi:hypothetical protein